MQRRWRKSPTPRRHFSGQRSAASLSFSLQMTSNAACEHEPQWERAEVGLALVAAAINYYYTLLIHICCESVRNGKGVVRNECQLVINFAVATLRRHL